MASFPEEGCALLLGRQTSELGLLLEQIWPCCNVWGNELVSALQKDTSNADRKERFAIDPREQLAAQRWSRKNGLKLIGVAHSHPVGDAFPSSLDCLWSESHCLMLILSGLGDLRAWWLGEDRIPIPLKIDVNLGAE